MEDDEKIAKLKEQFGDRFNPNLLVISRVPLNTMKRFKEMASDEEYCNDYGMLLRDLVKFYDGFLATGHEILNERIDVLEQEIMTLKKDIPWSDKKVVKPTYLKMADGRKVEVGERT